MDSSEVKLTSLEIGLFSEIEFEISHQCNMACSYCPNSQYERKEKGKMPLELFEKVLKELKIAGFAGRVSYHFYNEPLLSKDLEIYVKLTKEYLPQSFPYLFTNGTLLTTERFRSLQNAGIIKFHVTKHEAVPKNYVFEKTLLELTEKEKEEYVVYEHHSEIQLSNRAGLLSHIEEIPFEWYPCFIPLHLVVVTVEGNVLPCYDDYTQTLEMGNVKDESIMDIWNSEKYKKFREDLRQKKGREKYSTCKSCSNFKIS